MSVKSSHLKTPLFNKADGHHSAEMKTLCDTASYRGYNPDIIESCIYIWVAGHCLQFRKPSATARRTIPWVEWLYRVNDYSWNHLPHDTAPDTLVQTINKILNGKYSNENMSTKNNSYTVYLSSDSDDDSESDEAVSDDDSESDNDKLEEPLGPTHYADSMFRISP